MYDVIEPCSDSGAYVAEPKEKTRVDLEGCEGRLKEIGYEIKFSSEVIVVAEASSGIEVALYPSGKLLFKTCDKEDIEPLFEELKPIMKEERRG